MKNETLAIASDFVRSGMERADVPLTQNLEAYLSITFARFMNVKIEVDQLTVRVTRALEESFCADAVRALADECLIACALFERRLRRCGPVRHYVGLGQMSYEAAEMTEQAYGFVHMRDVITCAAEQQELSMPELVSRACEGSPQAHHALAAQNVLVGPWNSAPKTGLIWS